MRQLWARVQWEAEVRRQREDAEKKRTDLWLNRIMPQWERMKAYAWVQNKWREGLPAVVRGAVWTLASGNPLHLTEQLFQYYATRAQEALAAAFRVDFEFYSRAKARPREPLVHRYAQQLVANPN